MCGALFSLAVYVHNSLGRIPDGIRKNNVIKNARRLSENAILPKLFVV